MNQTFHVDPKSVDPFLSQIIRAAFPSYSGRTIQIRTAPERMNLRSYWDGGSRSQYVLVALATMRTVDVPTCHPAFDKQIHGIDATPIPDGVVVVEHCIFCGKDLGIRIHVPAANRDGRFLPPAVELSAEEAFVLNTTAGLISRARDEERQRKGMTRATWDACKATLIARGLLNKAGAITPAGRNAREALRAR